MLKKRDTKAFPPLTQVVQGHSSGSRAASECGVLPATWATLLAPLLEFDPYTLQGMRVSVSKINNGGLMDLRTKETHEFTGIRKCCSPCRSTHAARESFSTLIHKTMLGAHMDQQLPATLQMAGPWVCNLQTGNTHQGTVAETPPGRL